MKDSISKIQEEKTAIVSDNLIKLGSVVALKPHPYSQNHTQVKIATYNHLTPPLMVVVEKKKGADFNTDTGDKEKSSYKCLYFATVTGTFEENWFKREQIKVIEDTDNPLLNESKNKNLVSLKKELVGKLTTLRTVDLELQKKQVYQDSNGDYQKLKEKNLLDFLPPVGTIISIIINENDGKYNEKTGKRLLFKNRILVKLRWFNNKTSKFSEQELPLSSLVEICPHEVLEFKKDLIYLKAEKLNLEGNSKIKVSNIPVKFHDIIFTHYYYQYHFKNVFTGKIISIEQDNIADINPCPKDLKDFFEAGFMGLKEPATNYFTVTNEKKWKNEWYEIKYLARTGRYTQRIIRINKLVKLSISSKADERALVANCLLRKGAIRNFRLKGILGYRKMPRAFIKEMVGVLK